MKVKVINLGKVENVGELLSAIMSVTNAECPHAKCHAKAKKNEESKEITISDVIYSIAKKTGWKPQKVENYLNGVDMINSAAAFSIVLREIAVMLDMKYEDHIEHSERIFTVSLLDGRIHETPKKYIKNYRNFAAFRTVEDAKIACNILREPLKHMFSNAKSK